MIRQRSQQGVSIPAVLSILAIITILALTFLGLVRFQTQRTGFEQATITAGYVAEIGFQQIRAQLAATNGEWSALPNIENNCLPANPNNARCQRMPKNAGFSNFIKVHENPLDTSSRVIGIYEAAIETGEKRAIFGNKTITGSTQGFVPGSSLPAEQIGYDVGGHRLCNQAADDDECPGGFLGIKVTGWLTDASGKVLPKGRSQSVYGVLQMSSLDADDEGPSGYMLESNASIQVTASSKWDPMSWKLLPKGSFYGPMHTNERYEFEWSSFDTEEVEKGSVANTADKLSRERPYWGILMDDIGVQGGTTPRLFQPGTDPVASDVTYMPFGKVWEINWSAAGAEPAVGSTYEVFFTGSPSVNPYDVCYILGVSPCEPENYLLDSTLVVHAAANGKDYAVNPLFQPYINGPITAIKQGATTYQPGTDVTATSPGLMDWRLFDKDFNYIGPGEAELPSGSEYNVRYIAHSPITVFEKMTYSNGQPIYRYWHEHLMTSTWPYWQVGHGHGNVAGADLSVNSTAVGVDPGYDTTTLKHSHYITNDISHGRICPSPYTPSNCAADPSLLLPNTFLSFNDPSFAPSVEDRHEMPLLRPEAGATNYSNQLEQLNKYLELTLGVTLPRSGSGTLDDSFLAAAPYNATDYTHGYIVGKFPASFPNTTPPTVDFRAVYFGNNLKYTAGGSAGTDVLPSGSAIDQTAWIWVNDNSTSASYMKIAASRLDANYRRYLYRQIPPSKLILVRDAVILIGNLKPQGNPLPSGPGQTCQELGAHCLDFHTGFVSDPPGQATIVDGQLSIVSFTTTPPTPGQDFYYTKGDIVVVGNVLYHNDFFALPADKTQMRQLEPQPGAGYSRSNTVNGPITGIADSAVMWVTNDDGTRARDSSGVPVGTLSGLGLFATHDIKISVTPLGNGYDADSSPFCNGTGTLDNFVDSVTIHGQLVAGNRVRVNAFLSGVPQQNLQEIDLAAFPCGDEPPFESSKDKLNIYGTVYSRESPDFASYFRVEREYFFDRSLEKNPLTGAPYYPKTAGDYRNQTLYSEFPKLVQGTWAQTSQ